MLSYYSIGCRYFFLYDLPVFPDDQRRLHSSSKLREWGCTILLFMFGVMLRVRDGVATIPSTLIIHSSYTGYVDQCVTLTPSSFVSPEQAPLVSGVEKINIEREDL